MSKISRSAVVLAILFATANAVALAWRPAPPAQFAGITASQVPQQVGAFQAAGDMEFRPEVREALAAGTLLGRSYEATSGTGTASIDFILISGTDRSALHDPRSCLTGDGWEIVEDKSETLPGANIPIRACRVVRRGGEEAAAGASKSGGYEMLYLYVVDGKVIENVTEIRGRMLAGALLGRKGTPVHFLRFLRPVGSNEAADPANGKRLRQFAAGMWDTLAPRLTKKA